MRNGSNFILPTQAYASTMEKRHRYKKYDLKTKVAALDYLKNHSLEQTARTFQVDPKRIRDWRKDGSQIREQAGASSGAARKRLRGGGRKPRDKILEERLRDQILLHRENRLRVSRTMIQRWAREWSDCDGEFKASNGWLQRFLRRYGFSLRRRTSVSQKKPSDCIEKIVSFILYLRRLVTANTFSSSFIYAMDETPVWIEPVGSTSIDKKGVRDVPIKSTGHEKVRITVILTARGDGSKLKPYIVIPRKKAIKELQEFNNCAVISYSQRSWMDDKLTENYLEQVLGRFSFGKRLLVWDSFNCHKSKATKKVLKQFNIASAIMPGGCTSQIQPAAYHEINLLNPRSRNPMMIGLSTGQKSTPEKVPCVLQRSPVSIQDVL